VGGHQQHLDRRRRREVIVFDAAHDHRPIVDAINGRRVAGIVLTHGHNDHINAAVPLRDAVDAPILLHGADRMLWDVVWPGESPDRALAPGESLLAGGHELIVLHTPGHSPGCCSFHDVRRRRGVQRRHALLRRTWCDRAQPQRRTHDPPVDPRHAARPAR
jgi:glyoxylase-like metal-dependent hydrolase (beta-lactamase superfamily II)